MTKIYNLNVTCSEPLPSPLELFQEMPLTTDQFHLIESSRQTVKNILDRVDHRLLLIVGPCSIHNMAAAKEYASKISQLAKEVKDQIFLVMRVYVEKPRTVSGWKGFLYDPLLNGSCDIQKGICWSRQLFLELAELGVPTATEFLHPVSPLYYGDLITWGCVGARTASSQIHRQMVSSLSFPVAFKNNTDGNVSIAIEGVKAASEPQTYIGVDAAGRAAVTHSRGNPYGHIVLRGGDKMTNYDPHSIQQAVELLKENELNPRLVIDCSHGNSKRVAEQQVFVFQSLINQIVEGSQAICGMQVESNLRKGAQSLMSDPVNLDYGISLTDPCIDWSTTESMIRWAASRLSQNSLGELSSDLQIASR